jgi:hypothetical protein
MRTYKKNNTNKKNTIRKGGRKFGSGFKGSVMDLCNYKKHDAYNLCKQLKKDNIQNIKLYIKKNNYSIQPHLIEKDEEVYCRYSDDMNPIEFFATWGFVPEEYKSFNIPNQSLFVEISKNFEANSSFIKKDNRYYFNEDLIFKKQEIPTNINNFLKIFPNNQTKKIFKEIMDSYENSININLVNKILELKEKSETMINFCKSVKLYIENIRLYKLSLTL